MKIVLVILFIFIGLVYLLPNSTPQYLKFKVESRSISDEYYRYVEEDNSFVYVKYENIGRKTFDRKARIWTTEVVGQSITAFVFDITKDMLSLKKTIKIENPSLSKIVILSKDKLLIIQSNKLNVFDRSYVLYDLLNDKQLKITIDHANEMKKQLNVLVKGSNLFFFVQNDNNLKIFVFTTLFKFIKTIDIKSYFDDYYCNNVDYYDGSFYMFADSHLLVIDENLKESLYNVTFEDITRLGSHMYSLSPSKFIYSVGRTRDEIEICDFITKKTENINVPTESPYGTVDYSSEILAVLDRVQKIILCRAMIGHDMYFLKFKIPDDKIKENNIPHVKIEDTQTDSTSSGN
jgi:hypothetical protein